MQAVDRRIATRLVKRGWTVVAPDGTKWTGEEVEEDPRSASQIPWAKY